MNADRTSTGTATTLARRPQRGPGFAVGLLLLLAVISNSGCGHKLTPPASDVANNDSEAQTSEEPPIDPAVTKRLHALWHSIFECPPGAERDTLLDEMDAVPLPPGCFWGYWLRVHQVSPYDNSWTDEGFDPSKSPFPRDVQILSAVSYGMGDIENGWLHQFFGNSTDQFAPEMAEWFERANLPEAAKVFKDAMAVFGKNYSRSQKVRRAFLDAHPRIGRGEGREAWDPFYKLDRRLDAAAPNDMLDLQADAWLHDTCGIKRLRDRPTQ